MLPRVGRGDVMRRSRGRSFENERPRAEITSWEQIPADIAYEQRSDPAQGLDPLPVPFCISFIVLSSLVIYGAIYSLVMIL